MICSVKRFSEMYETVYRDLYHYALCLMKNPQEAEDAVSEAVVAAYENIHKLKKEEAFRSWIFTILTNKCKKRLKKALKGRQESNLRFIGRRTDISRIIRIRRVLQSGDRGNDAAESEHGTIEAEPGT